ncbi:hypothetical protein LV82_00846 [Albidovulum inexpectatum]|uniref:Uncharacterized protein n=1 Tax=Albidovulum inexpectatum TaxID=196587 RepID=A0A2S5JJE9_9RHOB|nr:hypothetical protein LV82_00846 [Albidovulum inexpectatum]
MLLVALTAFAAILVGAGIVASLPPMVSQPVPVRVSDRRHPGHLSHRG